MMRFTQHVNVSAKHNQLKQNNLKITSSYIFRTEYISVVNDTRDFDKKKVRSFPMI